MTLQNYIFLAVAHQAGRLQIPVHIHCGTGAQYNLGGAHPYLLEKAFIEVPETDFVLIHGGWPYTVQVTGLLMKSNVLVDFSAQEYMMSSRSLADVLRYWITIFLKRSFSARTFLPVRRKPVGRNS
jgi:predicted TIM-barrel fold metal-dependent hydrolase